MVLISLGGSCGDAIAEARSIRERAKLGQSIPIVIFSVQTVAEGAEEKIEEKVIKRCTGSRVARRCPAAGELLAHSAS
jgi:hypothetical protein